MPKVTEEYRENRRDEIASAAMRAFHRRGFQATSMADIIAESGLSAGAIYNHFKSKSDIVLSVATRVIGARLGEVEALARDKPMPPPAHLIRVLMAGMFRDLGQPGLLVQIWGEAVTDPAIRELATTVMGRLRGFYIDYITAWHVEQGVEAETATALAREQVPAFLGAAQGYILQSALFDDFDGEAYLTSIERYLPR